MVNDEIWRHHRDRLGADLVERFTFAQAIGPAELLGDARLLAEVWRTELADVLGAVGVLVLPTALAYPARLGQQGVAPNRAAGPVNLARWPLPYRCRPAGCSRPVCSW